MTTSFDSVKFTIPYNGTTQLNHHAVTSKPENQNYATAPSKPDDFTRTIDSEAIKAEAVEQAKREIKLEQLAEEQASKKKNKLSFFEKCKRFVGSMKKAGVTIVDYTKGTILGAVKGAAVGGIGFGACKIVSKVLENKEFATKGKNFLAKIGKSPRTAKVVGAGMAIIGLGTQLWKTSLEVNEKKALIDHKYETTHVNAGKNKKA